MGHGKYSRALQIFWSFQHCIDVVIVFITIGLRSYTRQTIVNAYLFIDFPGNKK